MVGDRVADAKGRVAAPVVEVTGTGGTPAAIVNVDTIDGVGSKASTFGSSATPSPSVAGPGPEESPAIVVVVVVVAGVVVVVVVSVVAVVVVVGMVDVVESAATVVVVVVVARGRIGNDNAPLRSPSSPAHCFVPVGIAPTSRSSSTSLAVRLPGS